jgi:hypothetical protein
VALAADQDAEARISDRIRLLADIRAAFAALGNPEAATTKDLLQALNSDTEAPWAGLGPGGLTGKRLGDMLSEFEIRSDTIRFPVGQAKGYHRPDFTDAWARYCPPPAGVPVPSVPSSFSQLTPGTDSTLVRIDPYQETEPWYGSIRTSNQSVPHLSSQNELGTDGTGTPRNRGGAA